MLAKPEQVEKVFHPAIGGTEDFCGMEFLGDGRLRAIDQQGRWREIQGHRPFGCLGLWNDGIAEPDINLHGNPHIAE